MVTGFGSALSAYGKAIYVGLEWFVDPKYLGLPRDDPLHQVLSWLSRDPTTFISSNAIHELIHILTPRVSGDTFLTRIIEEGRASLVTTLPALLSSSTFSASM